MLEDDDTIVPWRSLEGKELDREIEEAREKGDEKAAKALEKIKERMLGR